MNCNHLEAIALVQKLAFTLTDKDYQHVEVVVLPPFTDLRSVQTLVDGDKLKIGYGAQDISPARKGAYTGEISGPMLAKLGCSYVAVRALRAPPVPPRGRRPGQRQGQGRARGLGHADPVRGRAASRSARPATTWRTCMAQLERLAGQDPRRGGRRDGDRLRAGLGDRHRRGRQPRTTRRRCAAAIREHISAAAGAEAGAGVRILYGGSVKGDNIAPIMAEQDVDGALVGGASLDAGQFAAICRYRELAAGR